MMRAPGIAAAWMLVATWTTWAQAQDRRVIQNRTYSMAHEFTFGVGAVPLDVLYKAPTLTGRYTWHINDFVAWEALSLSYAPSTDLSVAAPFVFSQGYLPTPPFPVNHFSSQGNTLIDNFGFTPFDIDQMRLLLESNLVLTPLYGKFSIFNRSNARLELFGVGGLAAANYVSYCPYPFDPHPFYQASGGSALGATERKYCQRGSITDPSQVIPKTPQAILPREGQSFVLRPGVDVGGGTRLLVGKHVSFRLDGRLYGFLEGYNGFSGWPTPTQGFNFAQRTLPTLPIGITQVLYIGAGMSVSFGGGS